jgi:hypothetical protein
VPRQVAFTADGRRQRGRTGGRRGQSGVYSKRPRPHSRQPADSTAARARTPSHLTSNCHPSMSNSRFAGLSYSNSDAIRRNNSCTLQACVANKGVRAGRLSGPPGLGD